MKSIAMISFLVSYFITSASHPMILISLISTQALMICLIMTSISPTSWFSFILFLVFMGGLMVLFVYVSSLAANEKFNLSVWETSPTFMVTTMGMFGVLFYFMNSQTHKILINAPQYFVFKMYNPSMVHITLLTMIYLLLALIIIVNITTMQEGSLRQLK